MKILSNGKRRRKVTSAFCSFLIILLLPGILLMELGGCGASEYPEIQSEAAILADLYEDHIYDSKNGDQALMPASLTKLMTVLVALEEVDPALEVTVSERSASFAISGNTHISLRRGEVLTMKDLLYASMLSSANDAAEQIGETVAIETGVPFTDLMNRKAKDLGCRATVFQNACGLPEEGHISSAADLILITREAMKREDFRDILSATVYRIPKTNRSDARVLKNYTAMYVSETYKYDGVIGGKTGYAKSAGYCLITVYEKDGTGLICCTLNAAGEEDTVVDHASLYDQVLTKT